MAIGLYKSDQGYWTRTMSAVGMGVIGLAGAAWLWNELSIFNNPYVQGIGAGMLLAVVAVLTYWIYGANPRTVDFFVATEGELKKVNWSTRKEIVGSTWVVVTVALSIAVILFVVDIVFKEFFSAIGVLTGGSEIGRFFRGLFGGG